MHRTKDDIKLKRRVLARRLVSIGNIKHQLPWVARRNPKAAAKWIELDLLRRYASPYCYNYPFILQIEVTNLCNLHCKMCPRDREFKEAGITPSSMSFDTFDKIMRGWIRHVFQIHLFGRGEPLLARDLPKMIEYAAEHGVPFITFNTNGHLLRGEVAEALACSELDEVRVSIDGSDEQGYRSIRGVSLQRVKDNLKAFRTICDIPISIATTLCKDNWDSVYHMPELAAELGATSFRMFPVSPYVSLGMYDTMLTQEQKQKYRYFCRDLKSRFREKGINFIPNPHYAQDCKLPFIMAFIDVEGNLTPCCKLETMVVGNVLEQDFVEVWRGPKMTNWRKLMISRKFPKQCKDLECIRDWR
jgi:MoaA/NifB/PqqE/SkfB family radical SAM enzyme